MRVTDKNGRKKDIPKKYGPIIEGFEFSGKGKRLTDLERCALNIRLTVLKIQKHFAHSKDWGGHEAVQAIYAYESSLIGIISSVTKVKKRDGISRYDVVFLGRIALTVSYNLICDYPKDLILDKNEF